MSSEPPPRWLRPLTYIPQGRCRWAQQPCQQRLSRAGICVWLEMHPAEPPSLHQGILELAMPSSAARREAGAGSGYGVQGFVSRLKKKTLQRARHGGDLCLFCSVNNPWHVLACGIRVDQTKLHLNYNRARYLFFNIFLWSPSLFIVS